MIWVGIVVGLIIICLAEFIFLGGLEAIWNLVFNIREETIKFIEFIIKLMS